MKPNVQCPFPSSHQIIREIVRNRIGPSVVHDLVEGHGTIMPIECNAHATAVFFEKIEPASIGGITNRGRGVVPRVDCCNAVRIARCTGKCEPARVNLEFLVSILPASSVGRSSGVLAGRLVC